MRRFVVVLGALSSALSLAATASADAATTKHRHHTGYNSRAACERERHRSGNTGTLLGAIGGGVIGSQMASPGSRTLGTVLGAGGGAVLGHHIAKSSHRCR